MWQWIAVGAIALALSVAYAAGFGVKTQLTYLVEPLRHVHPELFRNDWLIAHTTAYHPTFAWLAAAMFRIDDNGAIAFFVAQLIAACATYLLIDRLCRVVSPQHAFAVFLVLAGWLALTEGRALAGTYLWSGYFQPSSLATIGWLIALVAWLRQQHLRAGIALAVAGAFHVNFLVVGLGLFTLVELTYRPWQWRSVVALVVPQLVVLVWFLPTITATASDPALALRILTVFHQPGHYHPYRITFTAFALIGWATAAWAVLPVCANPLLLRLWRFSWIAVAICLVMTAIIWWPPLRGLTRLFVWRMAPFAQLGCQLIVVLGVFAIITGQRLPTWRSILLVAAVAEIAAQRYITFETSAYVAIAMLAIAVLATRWLSVSVRRLLPVVIGVALCGLAVAHERARLVHPRITASADDPLFEWARQHTDVDAVFMIPPGLGSFRLLARRAVVGDSWSPPLVPDELAAWYHRLCAIVDLRDAVDHGQVERQWKRMPGPRLVEIARGFGATYLVVEHDSITGIDAPIAFKGDSYTAYGPLVQSGNATIGAH